MGTKSCTKMLIFSTRFRANILPSKISTLRSFWRKNLVDGEMFRLVMALTHVSRTLLCGVDTKFEFQKAGNGDVFFKWVRLQEQTTL